MKSKGTNLHIGFILLGICLLSFFCSFLPFVDPEQTSIANKFASPSAQHLFGCDNLGRDVLSRVLSGTQKSMLISVAVNLLALLFGGMTGAISGFFGKWLDALLTQFSDAFMAIPGILLAMMLLAIGGRGMPILILSLSIVFFPSYSRIFRNNIRQLKEYDYILQARLLQVPPIRLFFVHIIPALIPRLLPAIVLGLGNATIAEASLSYLGLGVQPPDASWGKMLSDGQSYLFSAPWIIIFPALFLILYVLGLHFVSEKIRVFQKERR